MAEPTYSGEEYFATRFPYDESKQRVWDEVGRYLERQYGVDGTVVDVGAGYGYFLEGITADRKIAVDVSPFPLSRTGDDVEAVMGNATSLPLADGAADVVLASNLLEHFQADGIRRSLAEFRRVLSPNGTLFVVTPNFALAPRRYFDDFTHQTALTHRAVDDLLAISGFAVRAREVRFLPFSAEGRLPVVRPLVRLYLGLPVRPFAGQSLFVAEPTPA